MALGKLPSPRAATEEGKGQPPLSTLYLENSRKGHYKSQLTQRDIITNDLNLTKHRTHSTENPFLATLGFIHFTVQIVNRGGKSVSLQVSQLL